jgi:histidinol-phosphate aminotransferase
MKKVEQLTATPNAQAYYESVEQLLRVERQAHQPVRLHCNESPFELPQALKQELVFKMADLDWNRYPDFHQKELKTLLAGRVGVSSDNILLGNGSSQLIAQIIGCCAKYYAKAVIESPTFTFYHQVCQNEHLPYEEWMIDEAGCFNLRSFPALTEPAVVILTSPNNPTGATLPLDQLEALLQQYPHCVFVVDEAYGEFGGDSAAPLVNQYANLLVVKTLSKGCGLPSIRFGYAVAGKPLMQLLNKYTVPFTINIFTEFVVRELLTNPAVAQAQQAHCERIKNLRDFVYHLLCDITTDHPVTVMPSSANFLLLRFQDTSLLEHIKQALQAQNILVAYPVPQSLRLTIGTEVEMNRVLRIFKQILMRYRSQNLASAALGNSAFEFLVAA